MSMGDEIKHPSTLEEAVLTKGVAMAIAYAAWHPEVVGGEATEEYLEIMDAFQDWMPARLIPENLWWSGHSWSSGRKCNVCHRDGHEVAQCDAHAKGLPIGATDLRTLLTLASAGNRHTECTSELCAVTGTRPATPNVLAEGPPERRSRGGNRQAQLAGGPSRAAG